MTKILIYLFYFGALFAAERDQVTPIKNLPGTMLGITAGQSLILDVDSPGNRSELSVNRNLDLGYKESLPLYIKHLTAEHQKILESILSQTNVEKIGVFEHYVTSSTYFSDLFYLFEEMTEGLMPDESIHVLDALVCVPVSNLKTFQRAYCDLKGDTQHFYLKKKLLGHLVPLSSDEHLKIKPIVESVIAVFNKARETQNVLENLSISLWKKENPLNSHLEKIALIGVLELTPSHLWPFLEQTIKNNPTLFYYLTFQSLEKNLFHEIQFAKKKKDFDIYFLKSVLINSDCMIGFQSYVRRKLARTYALFYNVFNHEFDSHAEYCTTLQKLAIVIDLPISFNHFEKFMEKLVLNQTPTEELFRFIQIQQIIINEIIKKSFITNKWENIISMLNIFMFHVYDSPLFIFICKDGFYSKETKKILDDFLDEISELLILVTDPPSKFISTLEHFFKNIAPYKNDYKKNSFFQRYYLKVSTLLHTKMNLNDGQ